MLHKIGKGFVLGATGPLGGGSSAWVVSTSPDCETFIASPIRRIGASGGGGAGALIADILEGGCGALSRRQVIRRGTAVSHCVHARRRSICDV